jgi:histidinol-phosphate/aromatic aminotransferase/cobyric acid decarboxylase-like protein
VIPHPGDHGGDAVALARALGVEVSSILDLSVSVNPVTGASAAEVVRRHAASVERYPDAAVAVAALADCLGVDDDRVVLTNGGAEAIALVAAEWPEGWVEEPDFALYRRHLGSVVRGAPVWRSNPHNPSGRLAAVDEAVAVWDEAFYPLATGRWTRGDADRGAVVVGSLTKLLACPGLRIGYVLAPDADVAARVRARQPRWSVNGPACAALPELLAAVDVEKTATVVAQLRAELVDVLGGHGLGVEAADAPWVLVRGVPKLRRRLAVHGVLVRDCMSFGMPDTVRIAVPDEHGLARLDRVLGRSVTPTR